MVLSEVQLSMGAAAEGGVDERAELSPWAAERMDGEGFGREESEEGEERGPDKEQDEAEVEEAEKAVREEAEGEAMGVREKVEDVTGVAGEGGEAGVDATLAPSIAATSPLPPAVAVTSSEVGEGVRPTSVLPGSAKGVKPGSPAVSRSKLGSPASPSGRRKVGGGGRGRREVAALLRLPTPPIFVLLDSLYQAEGIVHMRAQLHVKVVNQDKLPSPVEAPEFELTQLSGPLPLDFEVRALSRPGVFRVEYSARMAGLFTFKLTCRGRSMHRQSEPLSIQVSKPTTCAENCIAKGADLRLGTAGQRGSFDIVVRDQLGYPRTTCPEQFAMGITGPAKCQHASIGEFSNGRLPVVYYITKSGIYKVSVRLGSSPIGGSPYYLEIRGGEPSLDRTRATLPTCTPDSGSACHMRAGQAGLISVACYDVYGNLNMGGHCELQVSMYHEAYPNVKLKGRPTGHRKGSYTFEFIPEVAGQYVLQGEMKVGDEWKPLYYLADQMVAVGAGYLDPKSCFVCSETAAGNRGVSTVGVVGEWLEYSMQGVDNYGNVCKERVLDTAVLKVSSQSVESPDLHTDIDALCSVEQEMRYGDDGTITFRYRVTVAGRYMSQVFINGTPIGGSAQHFTFFSPGTVDPAMCVLTATGFQDALVGVCASVTIETRDVFGNRLGYGGLEFSADVKHTRASDSLTESIRTLGNPSATRSATQAEIAITDDDTGRYLITILPKEAGLHVVSVLYKHRHARQDTLVAMNPEPLWLSVSTASTMARGVTIPGNSFRKAVAGQLQSFTMWALEPGTNTRQTKGGERFALHLAMLPGTSRRALLLTNEVEGRQGKKGVRGGTKTVSDKAALLLPVRQKSMKATSSMKLGDSSPLKGRKTFAAQAFRDVVAVAPRTLSMRVRRRGLLEDQSELSEEAPDTETISTDVVDNGNGSYTVTYTPHHAAVYLLRVSRNGIPMPFTLARTLVHVQPTKLHGPSTALHGPGLRQAEVGTLAVFRLQLCDRFCNMVPDEAKAHRVSVEVYKEFVPPEQEEDTLLAVSLTDTGAGQHEARFSAEQSGSYVIEIALDGVVQSELERRVMFTPTVTDPSRCVLSGTGLRRAAAGCVGQLSIKTHDRFGNERDVGGDTFEATLQLRTPVPGLNQDLPAGALKLKVLDARNGQYEVLYRVKIAGQYMLRVVHANGPSVKRVIYEGRVDVVQAAPCAARCTATGPGLSGPAAHISAKVNVLVLDAFGNCVPLGTEPPEELTRLGQDLQAAVQARQQSTGSKGRGHRRDPNAAVQSLVAEVEAAERRMTRRDDDDDSGDDADDSSSSRSGGSAVSIALTRAPLTPKGFLGLHATLNSADADEAVRTVCTVAKAEKSTEGLAESRAEVVAEAVEGGDGGLPSGGGDAKGLSSYILKFTPPRAGLFMLEVVLDGTHILGSPFRIQAHEEHILGAFPAEDGGLDHLAEQALMFARMRRSQGVLVYNRKLGDPTTTGRIASVDTSLIKSGVWDASTSSMLKQVGLNPTVTTAAARIAELEQLQRYEMRKQSALMHLRIANLKHTFGESFEREESERDVLRARRDEREVEEKDRSYAIQTRPRRSSDPILPPIGSDVRPSPSDVLRLGSFSERETGKTDNEDPVNRKERASGSRNNKPSMTVSSAAGGIHEQPSTSGNVATPNPGYAIQPGSYVNHLSALLDEAARL